MFPSTRTCSFLSAFIIHRNPPNWHPISGFSALILMQIEQTQQRISNIIHIICIICIKCIITVIAIMCIITIIAIMCVMEVPGLNVVCSLSLYCSLPTNRINGICPVKVKNLPAIQICQTVTTSK